MWLKSLHVCVGNYTSWTIYVKEKNSSIRPGICTESACLIVGPFHSPPAPIRLTGLTISRTLRIEIFPSRYESLAPRSNRIALFATWTKLWVANMAWTSDTWHWGAAFLGNAGRKGKHLIIFDCEANLDQDFSTVRPEKFMLSTQLSFIKWARLNYQIDSLWYGNGDIEPTPMHCVRHTVDWIDSFAPQLEPMVEGSPDDRLHGFLPSNILKDSAETMRNKDLQ